MGGTTQICAHCGRPVLTMPAYGNAGEVYHFECTQSPYVGKLSKTKTDYIGDLIDTHLYGESHDEVVETLVLRGIREAIEKKLIAVRTFEN